MSSNCTGEVQAGTGISGRYQLSSYHALYKYENIGYGQVPDDRLYNTYEYEFMNVVAFSYSVVCSTAPARELVYSSTWYQVWKYELLMVFFLLFCTCLQFALDVFIVHPPPRELAYSSSWYCTNAGTRTRYCDHTGIRKEKIRKKSRKQGTKKSSTWYSAFIRRWWFFVLVVYPGTLYE